MAMPAVSAATAVATTTIPQQLELATRLIGAFGSLRGRCSTLTNKTVKELFSSSAEKLEALIGKIRDTITAKAEPSDELSLTLKTIETIEVLLERAMEGYAGKTLLGYEDLEKTVRALQLQVASLPVSISPRDPSAPLSTMTRIATEEVLKLIPLFKRDEVVHTKLPELEELAMVLADLHARGDVLRAEAARLQAQAAEVAARFDAHLRDVKRSAYVCTGAAVTPEQKAAFEAAETKHRDAISALALDAEDADSPPPKPFPFGRIERRFPPAGAAPHVTAATAREASGVAAAIVGPAADGAKGRRHSLPPTLRISTGW